VAAGATSIPISSITANKAYATGVVVGFTNDDWIHWDLNPYQPLFTRKINVVREISQFQLVGTLNPAVFPNNDHKQFR